MKDDLTIKGVAKRENVSRQTVHNWINAGLPSRLVSTHGLKSERRITAADLDAWLDENRTAEEKA